MKKCSYILSFLLLLSIFALAGEDYLVDENVAVFYPNDYKAVYTQPSVIFSKEIYAYQQDIVDKYYILLVRIGLF